MSVRLDMEQLMMDALDQRISQRDRALLETYLSQHPDERDAFERMQQTEAIFKAVTISPAPAGFTTQVMNAVTVRARMRAMPAPSAAQGARAPQPWLTAPQAVFLAMVAAMLAMIVGVGTLALLSLGPDTVAQIAPPAAAAIWIPVSDFIQGLLQVASALLHAIFSQPVTWLIALVSICIASLWARIVLALLIPTLRLMLA